MSTNEKKKKIRNKIQQKKMSTNLTDIKNFRFKFFFCQYLRMNIEIYNNLGDLG